MSGSAIMLLAALGLAAAQSDSTSPPAAPESTDAAPAPPASEETPAPEATDEPAAPPAPDHPPPAEGELAPPQPEQPQVLVPADEVPDSEPVEGGTVVVPDAVSGTPATAPSEIEAAPAVDTPPPSETEAAPAADTPLSSERPSMPAEVVVTSPRRRRHRPEPRKSGLFGWGLGLEIPTFGVMSGMGELSRPGWGYWLAGALSWEVTPKHLVRLYGSAGQTYGAKAGVRYLDNVNTGELTRSGQSAEWLGMEVGIGAVYLLRSVDRAWTPFFGGDLGFGFFGYDFTFDERLEEIEAIDTGDAFRQCLEAECRSDQHDGLAFGLVGTLRVGTRLELTRWLSTQTEIDFATMRITDERVSNTVHNREVRTAPETLLLIRWLFTVRVGL